MIDDDQKPPPPVLRLEPLAVLRARVAAMGPRRWLLRGLWPAGDYGVFAAPPKAQKTMTTADVAVSVAAGVPWLGLVEVETPGPVIMFVGEGGEADTVRRLTATAEARGLDPDQLPIHVCTRAPIIGNVVHLAEMQLMLDEIRPVLVTLDPLYLSAKGADLGDVYKMGALLHGPQLLCQAVGASLWVVHHFNRQAGSGAGRMAGAGPREWGRVLISAAVKSRRTDHDTLASTVVTELDVEGGGIPDLKLRIVRTMRADDPEDLDSPLHIETTATWADSDTPDEQPATAADRGDKLKPSQQRLLRALDALDRPATIQQLGDWMAAHDAPPLKRETCSRGLNELAALDLVDSIPGTERFEPTRWFRTAPRDPRDVTRDGHTDSSRVTRVTAHKDAVTSHGHTSHDGPQDPDHTSDPTLLEVS